MKGPTPIHYIFRKDSNDSYIRERSNSLHPLYAHKYHLPLPKTEGCGKEFGVLSTSSIIHLFIRIMNNGLRITNEQSVSMLRSDSNYYERFIRPRMMSDTFRGIWKEKSKTEIIYLMSCSMATILRSLYLSEYSGHNSAYNNCCEIFYDFDDMRDCTTSIRVSKTSPREFELEFFKFWFHKISVGRMLDVINGQGNYSICLKIVKEAGYAIHT